MDTGTDYSALRTELEKMARATLDETVDVVSTRPLSPEEAIGRPEHPDFPLLKGKEVMIEARFKGARGQAFTDMPGNFHGSLKEILGMGLQNNFERAVLVSGLNAVMRHASRVSRTVHCRDGKPKECARQLPGFVRERFGNPRIAFVGYQPAMIEALSGAFSMRVMDLDADNIGSTRYGIVIEGPEKTKEALEWADIILATGSTCVNATIFSFLGKKPVVFYGVTIAGAAEINGYDRYCPCSE
jgi:hypothetical protein